MVLLQDLKWKAHVNSKQGYRWGIEYYFLQNQNKAKIKQTKTKKEMKEHIKKCLYSSFSYYSFWEEWKQM